MGDKINSTSNVSHIVAKNYNISFGMDHISKINELAFAFSDDYRHVSVEASHNQSVFWQIQSVCSLYKLGVHLYDHPEIDPDFTIGAKYLPLEYDEDMYMMFLNEFGTHVANELTLGGRWGWQMEFKFQEWESLLDNSKSWGIGIDAAIALAGQVHAGFHIHNSHSDKFVKEVTKTISRNSTFNTGGHFTPDAHEWNLSVSDNPMPVYMTLQPIQALFTELYLPDVEDLDKKRANLDKALDNYCAYLVKTTGKSVSCEPNRLPSLVTSAISEASYPRLAKYLLGLTFVSIAIFAL